MRLPLLAAAVLSLPLTLSAETLRGIPADVDFAMHVSYDEAAKSQLYPVSLELQKRMEVLGEQLDPATQKRSKELMDRLGVKPRGMHTLDLGVRIAKGATEEDEPSVAVFCVGRLDLTKASLESFAKAEGVAPVAAGGVSGWEFTKLAGALLRALGAEDASQMLGEQLKDYALVMPQDGVVIVCPVSELGKAAASYAGKAASYDLPASAQGVIQQTPLAHSQLHANVRKMQATLEPESVKTDKVGLMEVTAVVGEDSKSFLINGRAGFADEAKAKLAAQQLTSGLAIAGLATAEAEEDDADTKFYKGELETFLSAVTVKQEGAAISIRSAFPIERAKVLFSRMGDKIEQLARDGAAAKSAGASGAGAAQDDDEMDSPPARPKAPALNKKSK